MAKSSRKSKRTFARRVRVRVPASTSNLGCGFDCLGMALSLHNVFVFEPSRDVEIDVRLNNGDAQDGHLMAEGRSNLVWRSAGEVFRRVGHKASGMKIQMDISVPLARGLGSSATAIIAGVVGANAMIGSPLNDDEVFQLIANLEGHPDNVAASFYGGMTVAMMDKRKPQILRYSVSSSLRAVVAIPHYPVSTEKARAALPAEVAREDAVHNLTHVPFIIEALRTGEIADLSWAMEDRLHEPYRIALIRNGRAIRKAALAAGAAAVSISGAGPSLIAFCQEAEANLVAEAMRSNMKGARVEILRAASHGTRVTTRK